MILFQKIIFYDKIHDSVSSKTSLKSPKKPEKS